MSSAKPTNDVTELAKERNRQAAERTVTTWIGHSLLLSGFGIATEEISTALQRSFPANNPIQNAELSRMLGLTTIATGMVLLIPVIVIYRSSIQSLDRSDYLTKPVRSWALLLIVGSVVILGIVMLINVILIIAQLITQQ